ncbi:MAG: hypothetical protein ACO25B_07165 [Chitinophagaceae bacterium]
MRYLSIPAIVAIFAFAFVACKSSKTPATFCDTACLQDTIRFTGEHPLKPYVYIAPGDCGPVSIIRGHEALGAILKTDFSFSSVRLNPAFVRCVFNDTAYAYLLFNDCLTGRGYQVKLPFNQTGTISQRSSGINNIDPKFAVADNMIAFTDRGNIFVEEIRSGKKAMMTFGKGLDIDYDALHEYIDSVHVTSERIWVKVKIDDKWTELEQKITLE